MSTERSTTDVLKEIRELIDRAADNEDTPAHELFNPWDLFDLVRFLDKSLSRGYGLPEQWRTLRPQTVTLAEIEYWWNR